MNQAVWVRRRGLQAIRRLADCRLAFCVGLLGLVLALGGGCTSAPVVLSADQQHVIDRQLVEYPAGFELRRYVTGLSAPTATAFDADNSLLVAEGVRGEEPRIWRFSPNNLHPVLFYPHEQKLLSVSLPRSGWQMYGPIGGMVALDGWVIVTHRDENGMGVVTALDAKGGHKTLAAGFPAQGELGLTDLVVDPSKTRVWFGCGTVTNSGVVGPDDIRIGWVREFPEVHDIPLRDVELYGYKFQTLNPFAGLLGPADIAVTAPFQSFSRSEAIRVRGSPDGKPGGAIYSVAAAGGFANVEAHGVHNPRGLAFNEFGQLYIVNDGMEMRGTRPIKGDPDSMLRLPPGNPWLGWPDYTTDLGSVSDARYQAPEWMIVKSGYPAVRQLIDQRNSNLTAPVREAILEAAMPSLSGAGKFVFAPPAGPFATFQGSAIVTQSGDRGAFATGGIALPRPVGFKVVRIDLDRHVSRDFVRNVGDLPGSKISSNPDLIERPTDVKFGPDGALYILDAGRMEVKDGIERYENRTGQIFRLLPARPATTQAAAGK